MLTPYPGTLDTTYPALHQDLSRQAFAKFDAAQRKTTWAARENNYGFPARKCCIGGATSSNAVNLRALRAETLKGIGGLEREAAAGAVPIDID